MSGWVSDFILLILLFGIVPGYLKTLSINRPDRITRLAPIYVQLVDFLQFQFIHAPSFRLSTLDPFAKLRADPERGTLHGLLPLFVARPAPRLSIRMNLHVCSIAQIRNCHGSADSLPRIRMDLFSRRFNAPLAGAQLRSPYSSNSSSRSKRSSRPIQSGRSKVQEFKPFKAFQSFRSLKENGL